MTTRREKLQAWVRVFRIMAEVQAHYREDHTTSSLPWHKIETILMEDWTGAADYLERQANGQA